MPALPAITKVATSVESNVSLDSNVRGIWATRASCERWDPLVTPSLRVGNSGGESIGGVAVISEVPSLEPSEAHGLCPVTLHQLGCQCMG